MPALEVIVGIVEDDETLYLGGCEEGDTAGCSLPCKDSDPP